MKKPLLLALAVSTLLLPGCFRSRAEIAREKEEKEVRQTLHQNVVESSQSLERLQAEIGRLNGRIEELEHQRRKEMSAMGTSREASDKNAAELRARVEAMQKTQEALFEEIKRLKEENVQLIKNMDRPRAAAPAPAQKKKESGSNYANALSAYKAKDYETAAAGFRSFLEANPKSKRAMDARFFLADSLYRRKEYSDAIMEFSVIHEKAAGSALGRKSTLKIAESFKALGKHQDAKAFAQLLMQASPDSAEAKQARKFLR